MRGRVPKSCSKAETIQLRKKLCFEKDAKLRKMATSKANNFG